MRARCRKTAVAWVARPRDSNCVPRVYRSPKTVPLGLRRLSSANRCSKLSSSLAVSVPTTCEAFGAGTTADPDDHRDHSRAAPPPAKATDPGSHSQELELVSNL